MFKIKTKQNKKIHIDWRQLILLTILTIGVYVLLPQLQQFRSSFQYFRHADVTLLIAAFLIILTAAPASALTYKQLVIKPVPYVRIVLVQFAGMFINRLLPSGVGGISLFIDFFYRQGHSLAQASSIVTINNMIGSIAHISLLLLAILLSGVVSIPHIGTSSSKIVLLVVAVSIVGLLLGMLSRYANRFAGIGIFLKNFFRNILKFRMRKLAMTRAFFCAMLNTFVHIVALNLVMRAFGVDLSVLISIVVLSGGVLAATITPTPGGVVGAEAALAAVLIAYGVNASIALAVALSYRLVSYWLPIIPGIFVFLYIQKRRYI